MSEIDVKDGLQAAQFNRPATGYNHDRFSAICDYSAQRRQQRKH
jgi:hypothetical protein